MTLLDLCLLPWPRRGPARLCLHAKHLLSHRKVHRLLVMLVSVAAYTRLRSWLAGDHLVRIYRKVRLLHSLHLHIADCGVKLCDLQQVLRLCKRWQSQVLIVELEV